MNEQTLNNNVDQSNEEYSIPYVLRQIALIQADTAHMSLVAAKLGDMSDGDSGDPGSPGNIQGQAKAEALGAIVTCRETTNQQLIRFYEKLYDDLVGRGTVDPDNPAGI